ncbi:histamine N-methyltransferase A-like [Antedon mediterranea]|uniref:histamine N-methyltransferase A-like n=1 Tax=Antedon mediterranea TaxID=105859 RepID=UPI003AF62AF4
MAFSKVLSSDPDYYVKAFEERTKRQQRKNVLVDWTNQLVKNQLIGSVTIGKRPLKVLGVGSGSGEVELGNISKLLEVFSSIEVTVLEPSKKYIDIYKESLEKSKLKGLTYQWRQQTLDEYRADVGASIKYDIIFSVNSLYYVDDLKDSLKYLYEILEHGGKYCVILVTETTGCYRLWKNFSSLYQSVASFNQISSREVIDGLKALNIGYELERTRNDIDVTECFNQGSIEGKYMIDFLSQVVNLRESVSESTYWEFVDFLKNISALQEGYGSKLWLESGWEATFVKKQ